MKKLLMICLCALLAMPVVAQKKVYKFTARDASGKTVSLKQYKDKVLLIVNTATKCGFTPQYTELQQLYDDYRSRGFVVLDFPCNQFGEQAPGSYDDIHGFCTGRYGITFPQFQKIDVNGANEDPLYTWLKAEQGFGGFDVNQKIGRYLDEKFRASDANYEKDPSIKWNFTKFLIDRKGRVVRRFEPTADFDDIRRAIEHLL